MNEIEDDGAAELLAGLLAHDNLAAELRQERASEEGEGGEGGEEGEETLAERRQRRARRASHPTPLP